MPQQLSLIYGKLTVLPMTTPLDASRHRTVSCLCECGVIKTIRLSDLMTSRTTSCGCSQHIRKHNGRGTGTWWTWKAMRRRCSDPDHKDFKNYGGRGIRVCAEWDDPETGFVRFLGDMGERPPDRTLDRVDVEKGYEKSNCRWATALEQAFNKRRWTRVNARRAVLRAERQQEMEGWDAMEQEYLRDHPDTT